jgi:hypothetical protein
MNLLSYRYCSFIPTDTSEQDIRNFGDNRLRTTIIQNKSTLSKKKDKTNPTYRKDVKLRGAKLGKEMRVNLTERKRGR